MNENERTLEEDINLVRDITWSYVKTTGLDFDDLFMEACVSYLEAENGYDSSKAQKSTYMHHVICNKLDSLLQIKKRDYLRENPKRANIGDIEDIEDIERAAVTKNTSPEQYLLDKEHKEEVFATLSTEALTICDMVLKERNLYLPIDTPKKCRGVLYQELRKRKWSWGKIWKTFSELKQVFSEAY